MPTLPRHAISSTDSLSAEKVCPWGTDAWKGKADRAAGGPAGGPPARATFVELLPAPTAGGPACTLELETARGATLRIQLQGIAPPDLAALSRTFWHAAP